MAWWRKPKRPSPAGSRPGPTGRIGSMRVGEAIVPIDSVELGRHGLWVTARFPGTDEGERGPVTLYTSQGEEFSSGTAVVLADHHGRVGPHDAFVVTYELKIETINGVKVIW